MIDNLDVIIVARKRSLVKRLRLYLRQLWLSIIIHTAKHIVRS